MIGTSLGPYEILESLGAGGMGEVYLAEDTRLGRKVAIKVLPEEFASDPERLARFEQEARAAAALNHPHIAVVHDIGFEQGEQGGGEETADASVGGAAGTHFMVQEHLVGQSLRERLAEVGALPLDRALDLAVDVCGALVAAHRAGIVHRDLKPENIFVTEDGHAKVLDFGLAKLTEVAAATRGAASMSPTVVGTAAGQVMGTAGYMPPEQINGEEVDERADLFAFGAVLYEMATGRRAFEGENVHETLSRIISKPPRPLHEIRDGLPLKLGWIVDKALAKDPRRRYQTAADLGADLAQLQDDVAAGVATLGGRGEATEASPDVTVSPGISRRLTAAVAAAALLFGVLGTWLAMRPDASGPPIRLDLLLEEEIPGSIGSSIALSPRGDLIAYILGSYRDARTRKMMLRSLGRPDPTNLIAQAPDAGGPYHPFFSPDGQWVGFVTPAELRKVPITGGTSLPIATTNRSRGADWSPDGTIVYAPEPTGGLFVVSADGGDPEQLTELREGERTHRWPRFLPAGDAVLFTSHVALDDFDTATIEVLDRTTGERKVVHRGGTDGRYLPTGHLVYANGATLFAAPFDLDALETTGPPVPVVENVATSDEGGSHVTVSETGTLAYLEDEGVSAPDLFRLAWIDTDGTVEPLEFEPGFYGDAAPRLSPEADRIAIQIFDGGETHVWILEVATGASYRLTSEGSSSPVWSSDGEWVYFASQQDGGIDVFRRRVDLSVEPELVYGAEGRQFPQSISADDATLLLYEALATGTDIVMISLDGDPQPRTLFTTPSFTVARISPDGRWFVFSSDETGSSQIYAQEIETRRRRVLSTGGGSDPVWSADGTKVLYSSGPGEVSVVDVTREPEISFSAPRRLLEVDELQPELDVTAGGERLLGRLLVDAGADPDDPTPPHVSVVLDWFGELERLAPRRR